MAENGASYHFVKNKIQRGLNKSAGIPRPKRGLIAILCHFFLMYLFQIQGGHLKGACVRLMTQYEMWCDVIPGQTASPPPGLAEI